MPVYSGTVNPFYCLHHTKKNMNLSRILNLTVIISGFVVFLSGDNNVFTALAVACAVIGLVFGGVER